MHLNQTENLSAKVNEKFLDLGNKSECSLYSFFQNEVFCSIR